MVEFLEYAKYLPTPYVQGVQIGKGSITKLAARVPNEDFVKTNDKLSLGN